MPPKPRVIYWFRTDLRLHDSPALKAALDLEPECLYPVWCWDPHYVYRARVGPNRWQYLLDCQSDLSASITKLNSKSKLLVVREAPQTVLVKLFKAWSISHLVFEKDTDAYAKERDDQVMDMAKEAGVEVITKVGRTLFDPDELVRVNGGKPTMSINQVQSASKKLPDVPRPIPAPTHLPAPGDTSLHFDQTVPSQDPDINNIFRSGEETSYAHLAGPTGDFAVPTFSELSLKPATTPHRGGETVALSQLDKIIADETYTATFSKPDTAPTAFSPQSTTLLSPHLHFGSLSCRLFYHRAKIVIDGYKKGKAATIPTNLIGQLLFRDMYFGAQAATGHPFAQTVHNPNCRYIPWHLPSKISTTTGLTTGEYTIDSPQAEAWFQRWKFGQTGFPWIDALMRQLRQEGWIHHLGRHAVACFLTRGGCYIDWERGADVFAEWLIDHEVACNAGNWQWLSCTAFFSQFFRCYSPIAFPKKWDPEGNFVKRYVPELARYSRKYIYEPWTAPIADQKSWGCRITGDGSEAEMDDAAKGGGGAAASSSSSSSQKMKTYPKPMFDFPQRREICIESIKNAYKVNLHGADPDVVNGTWMKLFDDSPGRDLLEEPKQEEKGKDASGKISKGAKERIKEEEEDGDDDGEKLPRENSPSRSGSARGTDADEREAAETGEGEGEGGGNQDQDEGEDEDEDGETVERSDGSDGDDDGRRGGRNRKRRKVN